MLRDKTREKVLLLYRLGFLMKQIIQDVIFSLQNMQFVLLLLHLSFHVQQLLAVFLYSTQLVHKVADGLTALLHNI